jgi:hypothetical protein
MERGVFGLGHCANLAVHLGRGSLVEPRLDTDITDGFEETDATRAGHITRIFGGIETDPNMTLGGKVIDLVGLNLVDEADQSTAVSEVTVVQDKLVERKILPGLDCIQPGSDRAALSTDNPVDLVTLFEQELDQIRTVLTTDPCDKRLFWHIC